MRWSLDRYEFLKILRGYVAGSMLTTLKMTGNKRSYRRKVQQDTLGKVNRVKEIRRRGKDGLKINRQQPFVRKKVSRDVSVR